MTDRTLEQVLAEMRKWSHHGDMIPTWANEIEALWAKEREIEQEYVDQLVTDLARNRDEQVRLRQVMKEVADTIDGSQTYRAACARLREEAEK